MNERIRELVGRADGIEHDDDGNELTPALVGKDLEKFAELIVRECVDIADNYQDILGNEPECFNCRKVAYGIVDKIKEHFGVEE